MVCSTFCLPPSGPTDSSRARACPYIPSHSCIRSTRSLLGPSLLHLDILLPLPLFTLIPIPLDNRHRRRHKLCSIASSQPTVYPHTSQLYCSIPSTASLPCILALSHSILATFICLSTYIPTSLLTLNTTRVVILSTSTTTHDAFRSPVQIFAPGRPQEISPTRLGRKQLGRSLQPRIRHAHEG